MTNLPIKKIDQVDRYGNKVSMEWDNSYLKKKKVQDKLGNAFTLEYAIPEVPKMGEQDVPKYDHPGEPKGTDTVPAWLTPGEFVVNKEATQMYEPLIRQMNNHGRQVQDQKAMHASSGTMVPWITEDLLDRLRFAETGNLPKNKMVSSAGAVGPYQIMPHNFDGGAGFGTTSISAADAWDPNKSRQFAREYLTGIQRAFPDWSPEEVLRAYNWGPGNMRTWKKGNSNIRMPMETQQYSNKILGPGKSYAEASQGEGGFDWSSLNPFGAAHAQTVPSNNLPPVPKNSEEKTGWFDRWSKFWEQNKKEREERKADNEPWSPGKEPNLRTDQYFTKTGEPISQPSMGVSPLRSINFNAHSYEEAKEQLEKWYVDGVYNEDKYAQHLAELDKFWAQKKDQENKIIEKKKQNKIETIEREKRVLDKIQTKIDNTVDPSLKEAMKTVKETQKEKIKKLEETEAVKPPVVSDQHKQDLITTIKETVKKDQANKGDKPELTDDQKDAATNAGNNASKKEKSKAERFLRDLLGPLFNKPELKRMAIFYAGARLMGYDHGPSLMFSLDNYIKRVDGLEDAARSFVYSAAGQDHTDESLKNFMENDYDMSLLVEKKNPLRPTATYVTVYNKKDFNDSRKLEVMKSGSGKTEATYHRDLKTNKIVGDRFWDVYTDNSLYSKHSDKYQPYLKKITDQFKATLEDGLKNWGTKADGIRSKHDKLNITGQAQKIAKWVMDQGPLDREAGTGVEPNEVGGILDPALDAAMQFAINNDTEIHDLLPFVKHNFWVAKTKYPELFRTKLDTKREKDAGLADPVDLREFDTLKADILSYLLNITEENEAGETIKPFSGTDPDELFNIYIETTYQKWRGLEPAAQEVFSKKALENDDNIDITNGFFEFMRGRLLYNLQGKDY